MLSGILMVHQLPFPARRWAPKQPLTSPIHKVSRQVTTLPLVVRCSTWKSNVFLTFNRHIIKINYGADIEEFQCVICGKIVTEKFHMRMHVENWHFPGLLEYSCKLCKVKSDT